MCLDGSPSGGCPGTRERGTLARCGSAPSPPAASTRITRALLTFCFLQVFPHLPSSKFIFKPKYTPVSISLTEHAPLAAGRWHRCPQGTAVTRGSAPMPLPVTAPAGQAGWRFCREQGRLLAPLIFGSRGRSGAARAHTALSAPLQAQQPWGELERETGTGCPPDGSRLAALQPGCRVAPGPPLAAPGPG